MAGTKNSGRKKTPTAILEKRGSRKAKGRAQKEPDVLPDLFIEPSEMGELMRGFYDIHIPILKKTGILSGTDSLAFESMARSYCRLKVLNDKIGEGEESIRAMFSVEGTKSGKVLKISALIKLALEYEKFYNQQLQQFGLTPSGRTGVQKIDLSKTNIKKLT